MEIKALYRIVIDGEYWDKEVVRHQLPQLDTHQMFKLVISDKNFTPFEIHEIFKVGDIKYSYIVWFKPLNSGGDYRKYNQMKNTTIQEIEKNGWVKVLPEKDLRY